MGFELNEPCPTREIGGEPSEEVVGLADRRESVKENGMTNCVKPCCKVKEYEDGKQTGLRNNEEVVSNFEKCCEGDEKLE